MHILLWVSRLIFKIVHCRALGILYLYLYSQGFSRIAVHWVYIFCFINVSHHRFQAGFLLPWKSHKADASKLPRMLSRRDEGCADGGKRVLLIHFYKLKQCLDMWMTIEHLIKLRLDSVIMAEEGPSCN